MGPGDMGPGDIMDILFYLANKTTTWNSNVHK